MKLSELTAYASRKYQIQEQHKWTDFPGFSVLCHPQTGKWIALLMRQWDIDSGMEIERCDIKCGRDSLFRLHRSYLSTPVRMHGDKWISIAFDERTECEIVFQLLDQAVVSGNQHGYTIVLTSRPEAVDHRYQDTALPFAGSSYRPPKEQLPEKLREMRRMYEYGRESGEARAENFYRQAVFMEDYEDDCPWTGDFIRYFPTYHDLTPQQLRGYFTWRTRLRKGDYQPIAASAAYIYIYELLNGIGTDSPEDALRKLKEFESGYIDSGLGDVRMRSNLRRWMLEYAVLQDLSPELARQCADPEIIGMDTALAVLRSPDTHTDQDIFTALCHFGGKKLESSPVLAADPDRGMHLFGEVWRASSGYHQHDKDLFALCFGEKQIRPWYPLSNAVYHERTRQKDRDYILDDCRSFHCRNGHWQMECYEKLSCDRIRLRGFLHETDVMLRRYLKTGRYLRENTADEWVIPFIEAVTEADRKAREEAARPKITIDLSGLDQIRRDALATRDSLLVEEESEEEYVDPEPISPPAAEIVTCGIPLDPVQAQILHALLAGQDPAEMIRAYHLMPSIVADSINEAFFDELGDTVLLCENDRLLLVDDYREDLERCIGGTNNG